MAVIIVRPNSVTWNSAAVSGCVTAQITRETEHVEDLSDGAVFPRPNAQSVTRSTVTLRFLYQGAWAKFTVNQSAVLVVTGKDGLGSTASTYTLTNGQVRSVQSDMAGQGITVTLTGVSSNGSTDPLVIT